MVKDDVPIYDSFMMMNLADQDFVGVLMGKK